MGRPLLPHRGGSVLPVLLRSLAKPSGEWGQRFRRDRVPCVPGQPPLSVQVHTHLPTTAASRHQPSLPSPLAPAARRAAGFPPGLRAHVPFWKGLQPLRGRAGLGRGWRDSGVSQRGKGQSRRLSVCTQLPPGFSPLMYFTSPRAVFSKTSFLRVENVCE